MLGCPPDQLRTGAASFKRVLGGLSRRLCIDDGRCEPPPMPLAVSRSILALTVGLIDRLRIDLSTCLACLSVMLINIGDVDDKACGRNSSSCWRAQLMLTGDTMEPHWRAPDAYFSVHDLTVRSAFNAARLEPERIDQEVMGGLDVAVHQKRDYTIECGSHSNSLTGRLTDRA
jgi:hypothetical protein